MSGVRLRRGRPAVKSCAKCGEAFQPERMGSRFCSRGCAFAAQTLARKPCERCGAPLRDRKKSATRFCSRACSSKALTVNVPRQCSFCERVVSWGATIDLDGRASGESP